MGDTETPNVYPVVPPVGNIPTSRKQIYNTVMNFSSLQISTESEANTLHFSSLRSKIALAPPIFELDL